MAGFLKLFPTIIIMFPGLAARAYYEKCRLTNGAEFPNWCSAEFRSSGDDSIGAVSNGANTNAAYALLVVNEFPTGVVGIILASMVAAFFSSLASTLNSASTIFTIDIYWKIINPRASPKQIVFVGRLAVVFLVLISVAWLPILENQTGSLYIVCQAFGTYFAPTLTTVFLLGFFSSYITASGAFYGLLGGFIIGILRIIEYILTQNECHSFEIPNPKSSPTIGGNFFHCMHFQHFAILLTFTVAVLSISISFISKNFLEIEKPKEDLFSLDNGPFVNIEESKEVFSSANQNIKIWRNLNGILSIVVVAAAVSLYIIFY
jgi:Na+/proline symporter